MRKSYGSNEVVRGVDLELTAGECFALLGPNGASKSTILRWALGLADPDAGVIFLLGLVVPRRAREARVRVGVVPQTGLDPDFTVFENLLVYGRYFALRDADIAARTPPLLQNVSAALPLTHAIDLVRPLVTDRTPQWPWLHVGVLIVYAAAGFYLALMLTRRRLLT
jgi:ABC-type multidrug transport system ATPase subunit